MSDKDKLQKFMNFINEDAEWESLPTEEKLGRNVIYFMKKWGEAVKDNAIYRQENAQLEEENKSLRESIADLQKALEKYSKAEYVDCKQRHLVSRNGSCEPEIDLEEWGHEVATEALERLKARGHYVEVKK